ncbi:MAG: hypothetical protein WA947_19275, partial [Phormidesmis sp.]
FATKIAADKFEQSISLEALSAALSSVPLNNPKRTAHVELGLAVNAQPLAINTQPVDAEKPAVQPLASQILENQILEKQILENQDSDYLEADKKEVASTADTEERIDERLAVDRDAKPKPLGSSVPTAPASRAAASTFREPRRFEQPRKFEPPRKRLPNPNPGLARAAAVGMLDLSDKLLFGGEDDGLINTYLGGEDSLLVESNETVVFKYLSQQIAESKLTQVKNRLPLAVQPPSETEPSEIVLDASNFQVVEQTASAVESAKAPIAGDKGSDRAEDGSTQSDGQTLDAASMSQQIAYLSQKVESLSQELLSLMVAMPQGVRSGSDEAA